MNDEQKALHEQKAFKVTPLCDHFGRCGGCAYQDISHERQLALKKRQFQKKLSESLLDYHKPINFVHDTPYHYRNRMDFVYSKEGWGQRLKGEFKAIEIIKHCSIARDQVNDTLSALQEWHEQYKTLVDPYDFVHHTGFLKYAVVRVADEGDSSVTFIVDKDNFFKKTAEFKITLLEALMPFQSFADVSKIDNILIGYVTGLRDTSIASECQSIKGSEINSSVVNEKKIFYHSQSFFQNNLKVISNMIKHIISQLEPSVHKKPSSQYLLDYYGGSGSLGVGLSDYFKEIEVLDNDKKNIELVSLNAKINNIEMTSTCADAEHVYQTKFGKENFYLIVDPPRPGLSPKYAKRLKELGARQIIYVSCNPSLMIKELQLFLMEYDVRDITLFDMFPQTKHYEAVAILDRKN